MRVDWPTFWGAVFFLLIGGGFAIFGAYQLVTTRSFMAGAEPQLAVVVENPSNCDDDSCTWRPLLRLADGREARTLYGASNYGWGEGAEIEVLVNPERDYVCVAGADNLYLLGGAFLGLGLLPVVLAIWLLARLVFSRPGDSAA